jgi:hypothetical protein
MPSATATLYLNLTAIQQLCKGDPGKSVLNGTVSPTSAVGLSGDFYFNTTTAYPPTYYDLYGPKGTTNWAATALRIPSTTLLNQISSALNSSLTALSTITISSAVSALSVSNTNYATSLYVAQLGTNWGKYVADFVSSYGHALTITNSGTVAFFYTDPTTIPQPFSINSNVFINGTTTIENALSAIGYCYLGPNCRVYTGSISGNQYDVLTMNVTTSGETDAGFSNLSAYTVFFQPKTTYTGPVRVNNTRFEVGVGSVLTNTTLQNNGAYFIVDPVSAYGYGGLSGRGVAILGTLTATSAFSTNAFADTLSSNNASIRNLNVTNLTATSATFNAVTVLGALSAARIISNGNYTASAYISANQTVNGVLDFWVPLTVKNDPNSWITNTGTPMSGKITPTVAGYYSVQYQVAWLSGGGGNQNNIQIQKNRSAVGIVQMPVASFSNVSQVATVVVYMNGSTDYLNFTAYGAPSQQLYGETAGNWSKVDVFKIN